MNSRDRILNTLQRKPCDRIPVSASYLVPEYREFFANQEPSYSKLMSAIDELTDSLYPCWFEPLLNDEYHAHHESASRQDGNMQYTRTVMHTPRGDLSSEYRVDEGTITVWTIEHLLKDADDIDTYLSMPREIQGVRIDQISTAVNRLGGVKGIPWVQIGDPAGAAAGLFEFGLFLILCLTEKERIKYLLDALFEQQIYQLRLALDSMKALDTTCLFTISGPEYLTPPYLPEEYIGDFVLPYIKPMIDLIHSYRHYVSVHCHGNCRSALKYFIEAGADAVDPIEPPPDGDITLGEAKKLYGSDLVLIGNVEIRLLDFADRFELVRYVKDMVETGKQGGGYIAMPTSFPIDVPLRPETEENWITYIETAVEYGYY